MRGLARVLPVKTPKRALVHATIREQGLAPTTAEARCFVGGCPCGRMCEVAMRPFASGGSLPQQMKRCVLWEAAPAAECTQGHADFRERRLAPTQSSVHHCARPLARTLGRSMAASNNPASASIRVNCSRARVMPV